MLVMLSRWPVLHFQPKNKPIEAYDADPCPLYLKNADNWPGDAHDAGPAPFQFREPASL